jgi:hypothetical protein
MQFLALEQINHNPESPRDALFAANIEYNAPGARSVTARLHRLRKNSFRRKAGDLSPA